jgi:hypothetical protein
VAFVFAPTVDGGELRRGDDALTNDQGKFELPCELRDAVRVIRAAKAGYAAVQRALTASEVHGEDIAITLHRSGAMAGRVLWDEPLRAEALELKVWIAANAPENASGGRVALEPDGTFEARDLLPGRWVAFVGQGSDPLRSIGYIEVRAGETARDPRLDPLDLRGAFRVLRLRLLRPNGEPLADEEVALWLGIGAKRSLRTSSAGRIETIVPTAAERVLVDTAAFRSAWVEVSREEVALTLARPIALVIETDVFASADLPELLVRVDRVHDAATPDFAPFASGLRTFDRDGRAEFVLEQAGRYQVTWRARGVNPPVEVTRAEDVFDVLDAGDRQAFSLHLDEASLTRLRDAGR